MFRCKLGVDDVFKVCFIWEKLAVVVKIFRFIYFYCFVFGFGLVLLFVFLIIFMVFLYFFGLMVDIVFGEKEMFYFLVDVGWILVVILVI